MREATRPSRARLSPGADHWRWGRAVLLLSALTLFVDRTWSGVPPPEAREGAVGRPAGARPEMVFQIGHCGEPLGFAFAPDGRAIASASMDGTIKLWDTETGSLKRNLHGEGTMTDALAFSPDGRTLAAGNAGGTVELWDPQSGRPRRVLTQFQFQGHVSAIAFSPDGKILAVGTERDRGPGQLLLLETSTGKLTRRWSAHSNGVTSVAFSPVGDRIASTGSYDEKARVWDVRTGTLRQTLGKQVREVESVAYSPDGRWIVGGVNLPDARYGEVVFWDARTGQAQRKLPGRFFSNFGVVPEIDYSADGKMLATGEADGGIRLWDASSGRVERTWKAHGEKVEGIAFSRDGRYLASCRWDIYHLTNELKLWDAETGRLRWTATGFYAPVSDVAFSPDGRLLASGGMRTAGEQQFTEVALWDVRTGSLNRTLNGPGEDRTGDHVRSLAFSPDGTMLAAGHDELELWEVRSGKRLQSSPYQGAMAVAFSPDGRRIVSGSEDGLKLWDVRSGTRHRKVSRHDEYVASLAFLKKGEWIASAGALPWGSDLNWRGEVKLWEARTGRVRRILWRQDEMLTLVAASPDGRTVACASPGGELRLYDAVTGRLRRRSTNTYASALAFSPDGGILARATGDRVKLDDARSGRPLRVLRGHTNAVSAIAFAPGGRSIASGSADGTVKLWETASGRLRATLRLLPSPEGQPFAPEWIAFTPAGYYRGSLGAGRYLGWRVGDQIVPGETYESTFQQAEVVQGALGGRSAPPAH
jgi:WD40 repeat protein